MSSLSTNGNGNCSVHSVLGVVDEQQQLQHPDPAAWVNRMLAGVGTFRDVKERCVEAGRRDIWDNVSTLVSNELLLPSFDADDASEVVCFRKCLHEHTPHVLDVAREAVNHTTHTRRRIPMGNTER